MQTLLRAFSNQTSNLIEKLLISFTFSFFLHKKIRFIIIKNR